MRGNWGQQIVSLSPATTTRDGGQAAARRKDTATGGLTDSGRSSMTSAYVNWRVSGQERARIANFATAAAAAVRRSFVNDRAKVSFLLGNSFCGLISPPPVLCHSYFFLPVRGGRESARRSVGLHPPSLAPQSAVAQCGRRSIDRSWRSGRKRRSSCEGKSGGDGRTVRNEQQTEHRSNLATAAEEEEEEIRFPSFHPKRGAGSAAAAESAAFRFRMTALQTISSCW